MNVQATDPKQYDSPDLNWQLSGREDASSRKCFREALDTVIENKSLEGRSVLDIGCGVGQLFNWLKNKKISRIVGIDPSHRNVETAKQLYPWAKVLKTTLNDFSKNSKERFDVAFGVMVFEHIHNLKSAFKETNSLLAENGLFYLIIGTKEFHIIDDVTIRKGKFVSVKIIQEFPDGQVETKTVRRENDGSQHIMYDIFRPMENVRANAKEGGFILVLEKPMFRELFTSKYDNGVPFCYLFIFRKE